MQPEFFTEMSEYLQLSSGKKVHPDHLKTSFEKALIAASAEFPEAIQEMIESVEDVSEGLTSDSMSPETLDAICLQMCLLARFLKDKQGASAGLCLPIARCICELLTPAAALETVDMMIGEI